MDSEIIATLIQENEELNKKVIETERRLKDEEEITEVLSKRIHYIEQEYRRYVEKMQIYLQTEYKEPIQYIPEKEITRSNNDLPNIGSIDITYSGEYNDEILYEKPNLSRSTNEHEWSTYNEQIYPLEI